VSKSTSVQPEPDCSEYQRAKQNGKISDTQAHRRQQLATIPEDEFERRLAPGPIAAPFPALTCTRSRGNSKGCGPFRCPATGGSCFALRTATLTTWTSSTITERN
jgi:hypothetical protein